MKGLLTELKQFFNVKECGILFHDPEKHKLFTISSNDSSNDDIQN